MKKKLIAIPILVLFFIIFSSESLSAPTAPNSLTVQASGRRDFPTSGTSVEAQAGNVTQLFINDQRTTYRWQGYYGNVTGGITLDNANNDTLYDWSLASPQGEIYASNASTVTWSRIQCFNFSASGVEQAINLTTLESSYNMSSTDKDGVNETFSSIYSGNFRVGLVTISSANNCPTMYTFVNDTAQSTDYAEVLLTDNVSAVVYTSLLEQDTWGYDQTRWDFQMMVGENGDDITATTYYFFVELE